MALGTASSSSLYSPSMPNSVPMTWSTSQPSVSHGVEQMLGNVSAPLRHGSNVPLQRLGHNVSCIRSARVLQLAKLGFPISEWGIL